MAEKFELVRGAEIDCEVLYPGIDDPSYYALVQVGKAEATPDSIISAPATIAGKSLLRGMKLKGVIPEDIPEDRVLTAKDIVLRIDDNPQSVADWAS